MYADNQYIQMQASDSYASYQNRAALILGIVQVVMGVLSMCLGIGSVCTLASGWFIAYGIWCGFMFTLTGGICIGSAVSKSSCMIFSTMVLSIICVCLAIVQFSLGIVAADRDGVAKRVDIWNFVNDDIPEYDVYMKKNIPFHYLCAGTNFNWTKSWGPVDVLLLLAAFVELVCVITVSIFGCQAACCGKRIVTQHYAYNANTGVTGFSNEAYMTQTRMSPEPGLYKVSA